MYNSIMGHEEERLRAEVRKWGHSLGIVIPAKFANKLKLLEHEVVDIKISKRRGQKDIMDLFGAVKFKESTAKIKKELKEGWKD